MLRKLRRHRLSTRLSLLAITALLWSQMLLAFHADCQSSAMTGAASAEASAEHADCTDRGDATDLAVCQLHCSQGDASSDNSRAPSVPALPPVVPASVVTFLRLVTPGAIAPAPRIAAAWHRPTPHPASILLI